MDTEHRHELKTNQLADWIKRAPALIKQNANTIIGAALIIIGLITWPMFSRMRAASETAKAAAVVEAMDSVERDLMTALQASQKDTQARLDAASAVGVSVKALMEQAQKASHPDLKALALIKAAQALRAELHWRAEQIAVEDIQAKIKQAQDAYQEALKTAQNPTIKAMAQLGLGLCAEESGQRDQAASIYQAIINEPSYAHTHLPMLAQKRLDNLDKNMAQVVFAPAPAEPTPAEQAAQPAEPLPMPAAPDAAPTPTEQPAAPAPAPAAPAAQTPAAPAAPDAPAENKP